MVIHYKCPNCGADMSFDSKSGKLSCGACGRQDDIEEFSEQHIIKTFDEDETKEYHCDNCGAVIVTDADTAATKCSFCGAGVVLADRISGTLAPSLVIPFSVSKREAQTAFRKWCKNGLLTPKGFMTADRVKSMTGMYVPFWMYDLDSHIQLDARGTRVRSYSRGDYIYTETKHYDVYRDIQLHYLKVPVDASTKKDDELMDKLEPYPYDQLKPFKTPYLAGFIAEKYNLSDEQLFPRAKEKISQFIESYIQSTVSRYTSLNVRSRKINTKQASHYYVLLPVWMVHYNYKQEDYVFAMNGQKIGRASCRDRV